MWILAHRPLRVRYVSHSCLALHPLLITPASQNGIDYNIFDSLPILTINHAAHDELLTYLTSPCERVSKTDPATLMWWYDCRTC